MPTIAEVRAKYPQYSDMSDTALADALHAKFYADMPKAEFDQKVGLKTEKPTKGVVEQAIEPITSYPRTVGDMADAGLGRMWTGAGQVVSGAKTAVTPTPEGMSPADQAGAGPVSIAKGLGNIGLGAWDTVTSPISAAYRTIAGQPIQNITGFPKEYTEFGLALATPGIGFTRLPTAPLIIRPPTPLKAGEEVAAAGQRLGVDIPRAVTTDVPGVQQVAKGATSIPGVGTPIRQASEKAIADLGEAAQDVRAGYGSGNPAAAGTAAQQGITEALRNGPIKQRVTELYDRVDGLVNPAITGELPNTRNLVATIDARRVNAGLPESGATKELETALSRQGMNYEGIKDLRTHFGEMQDGNIPIPQGMSSGEVKQIYGALSNDMRLIIAKAGGQEGLKAFEQANRAAARWAGIREDLAGLLKVKNEEAIFDKIAAMAGSTARADINLLGRVRGAVGPQNWDEVASAVIGKMGWPPGGTGFSPDQFLTAYKKMSEEGRRLLFRSTNNASHADAIDDIAKVSERFKELNKYANPSGTATHGATFGLGALAVTAGKAALAGAVMEPLTIVSTIVGGRIASYILARPAPARAMANWANAVERVAVMEKSATGPASDYVRFYHGGSNPTSGGGRWVTPDAEYARNFRASGTPNEVHYVDIKRGSKYEVAARGWDDLDAGTNMVGTYRSSELPEHMARLLKPISSEEKSTISVKRMAQEQDNLVRATKIFAAAVGKDFGRPDLVPDLIKRLQGAVPAAAENEQPQPPGAIDQQPGPH